MTMLNLEAFRATAIRHDIPEALELLGMDDKWTEGSDTTAFWIYGVQEGQCFIQELTDDRFYLLISRSDWIGAKADLEARLYFDWFVSECETNEPKTMADLTGLLAEWAAYTGHKLQSADEMLADLVEAPTYNDHRTWLEWFITEWDDAEDSYANELFSRAGEY